MSHTPEQARELWCPMVRIARNERSGLGLQMVAGCNTDALGGVRVPASCRCIADKCAMWRWEPGQGDLVTPGASGYIPAHGYCGLAGAPAA